MIHELNRKVFNSKTGKLNVNNNNICELYLIFRKCLLCKQRAIRNHIKNSSISFKHTRGLRLVKIMQKLLNMQFELCELCNHFDKQTTRIPFKLELYADLLNVL